MLQRMKVSPAEDPEDVAAGFARYLHDSWGVGDRGCNNGVLLLVALQNRQVGLVCSRPRRPPPPFPFPPALANIFTSTGALLTWARRCMHSALTLPARPNKLLSRQLDKGVSKLRKRDAWKDRSLLLSCCSPCSRDMGQVFRCDVYLRA